MVARRIFVLIAHPGLRHFDLDQPAVEMTICFRVAKFGDYRPEGVQWEAVACASSRR
jgi:hypothetical protein